MFSGKLDNLLQYLFRIECTGRVIRIDDNNRFCAVGDLLSHIINVRIPFGLFVADVVDGFSAGQRCAGSPERVIREKETGAHVKFINLSGGVGIAYKPDQTPNDIREIGEGVRKVYEEVLVPAGMGDVAIYTEMGRFMMGPYGCLVTKAIHEKHTHKEYIGVDACAVNLMRPAMYGAYHHITVMGKEDQPCDHMYDVTGSLCENNDKFAIDRYLPKVDMGDLLVIHDTGAHGFAMGYNYNGKLKSSEILLHEDGSFEMIRRCRDTEGVISQHFRLHSRFMRNYWKIWNNAVIIL